MAGYRLELGFDWKATEIGDSGYRPLQMGLVNKSSSNSPAYYQFKNGETIDFLIFNIGVVTGKTPTAFTLSLKDPQSGETMYILGLTADMVAAGEWNIVPQGRTPSYAFSFSGSGPTSYPSWYLNFVTGGSTFANFPFSVGSGSTTCELSVGIVVEDDDNNADPQTYVGDPEMWVGEGSP